MKKRYIRSWFASFGLLLAGGGWSGTVQATELVSVPFPDETPNWTTSHPRIVFAISIQDRDLDRHYAEVARGAFRSSAPEIVVLTGAKSADVVRELQNPDTVGLVVIGHAFLTSIGTAALLDSERRAFPSGLISAATPALRFVAFFGCYGEKILSQYQSEYELGRLPGTQTAFYLRNPGGIERQVFGQAISTVGFFGIDGLGDGIRSLANTVSKMDLTSGVPPAAPNDFLTLRLRDVADQVEPRFVAVNGTIVGSIGSGWSASNSDSRAGTFSFAVPGRANSSGACQTVTIQGADLGGSALMDDYLVDSVVFDKAGAVRVGKSYQPAWHIGVDARPDLSANGSEPFRPEVLDLPESEVPADLYLTGDLEQFQFLLDQDRRLGDMTSLEMHWARDLREIQEAYALGMWNYLRRTSYLDKDSSDWPSLHSRFSGISYASPQGFRWQKGSGIDRPLFILEAFSG